VALARAERVGVGGAFVQRPLGPVVRVPRVRLGGGQRGTDPRALRPVRVPRQQRPAHRRDRPGQGLRGQPVLGLTGDGQVNRRDEGPQLPLGAGRAVPQDRQQRGGGPQWRR